MAKDIYQVDVVMSDGYYSVNDSFRAALTPEECRGLEAEFATLLRVGVLQEASVAIVADNASLRQARERVDRFIKSYPTRHFGGPGR